MALTVSDFIWQRLQAWGVRRVYGYPGDGIGGLISALARMDGAIDFVQARHEEMAGLMACGEAKFTGEVGVCIATSGPGAIHLLNGLYDAKLDHQPVLALVGQQARTAIGSHYQQDLDLQSLFKDVSGAYVETAFSAVQVRHLIDRAYRIAKSERRVTCIILPNDLQLAAMEQPTHEHGMTHSGVGIELSPVVPDAAALARAAEVLNAGEKVAMLVGAGALRATDEVIAVAERLGAGVAKALLGKAAVPDDLPFCTGSIGLLGTKASWDLMQDCDTLLMVGSSFPYTEFLPKEGQAEPSRLTGMRECSGCAIRWRSISSGTQPRPFPRSCRCSAKGQIDHGERRSRPASPPPVNRFAGWPWLRLIQSTRSRLPWSSRSACRTAAS
jgi:pyruvate dehydrogenase (quinone)